MAVCVEMLSHAGRHIETYSKRLPKHMQRIISGKAEFRIVLAM